MHSNPHAALGPSGSVFVGPGADAPCASAWRSAVEEELAGTAAERDRLAPEVEEARSRARQSERDAAEARAAAAAAQQVRPPRTPPCCVSGSSSHALQYGDVRGTEGFTADTVI